MEVSDSENQNPNPKRVRTPLAEMTEADWDARLKYHLNGDVPKDLHGSARVTWIRQSKQNYEVAQKNFGNGTQPHYYLIFKKKKKDVHQSTQLMKWLVPRVSFDSNQFI